MFSERAYYCGTEVYMTHCLDMMGEMVEPVNSLTGQPR